MEADAILKTKLFFAGLLFLCIFVNCCVVYLFTQDIVYKYNNRKNNNSNILKWQAFYQNYLVTNHKET
jgi:hypothetical protein